MSRASPDPLADRDARRTVGRADATTAAERDDADADRASRVTTAKRQRRAGARGRPRNAAPIRPVAGRDNGFCARQGAIWRL